MKKTRQLLAIPPAWIRPSNTILDDRKVKSIKKALESGTFPEELLIFPGKFFYRKQDPYSDTFYFSITDGNHRLQAMYELLAEKKLAFLPGIYARVYLLTDAEYKRIAGTNKYIDCIITKEPRYLHAPPPKTALKAFIF